MKTAENKRKKLQDKGWKVGTVDEFLNLTPGESTVIEILVKVTKFFRAHKKYP